jgi:hypothetical protein
MGQVRPVPHVRGRAPADHRSGARADASSVPADTVEQAFLRSAIAVLLQRSGGSIEYTEREFQAVHDRNGAYRLVADVDHSGPGEPRICVRIVPAEPG